MYAKQSLKKTALKIPFRALGWPFSEMARPWFCIAPCLWYLCITQLILWPTRYSRRFPSMVPCTVNRQHIFGRRFVLSCYPNNQRNIIYIYIYIVYIYTHTLYLHRRILLSFTAHGQSKLQKKSLKSQSQVQDGFVDV